MGSEVECDSVLKCCVISHQAAFSDCVLPQMGLSEWNRLSGWDLVHINISQHSNKPAARSIWIEGSAFQRRNGGICRKCTCGQKKEWIDWPDPCNMIPVGHALVCCCCIWGNQEWLHLVACLLWDCAAVWVDSATCHPLSWAWSHIHLEWFQVGMGGQSLCTNSLGCLCMLVAVWNGCGQSESGWTLGGHISWQVE